MKSRYAEMLSDAFTMGRIALGVMLPASALIWHVWHEYRIVHLGYEIAAVTQEHRNLLEENKKLSVEAAILGRSDRVTGVAREQFGLQLARPDQITVLENGTQDADQRLAASEQAPLL